MATKLPLKTTMVPFTHLLQTYRALLKRPALAATAIATLAIGIGANVLLFSIIDDVLLKPLAFPDSERIFTARTMFAGEELVPRSDSSPVSAPVFAAWRSGCVSCESMALIFPSAVNLGGITTPERVDSLSVSAQLFSLLGIQVQLGRGLTESDDQTGANGGAVISDRLWRRSFDSDPSIIGRQITWNRTPVQIVGVLTPDFRFPKGEETGAMISIPDRVDLIRPFGANLERLGPAFNYAALVKLRPGATVDQAASEMNQEAGKSTETISQRSRVRLLPLKQRMVRDAQGPLWMLWGAAAILLLIVCVNVGNLLMVYAVGRQREWAIRAAIGANRIDLCRQALAEAWGLAVAGGLLGLIVAVFGVRLLPWILPSNLPRIDELDFDWRVLLATLLFALAAGTVCSIAPMWRMLRTNPQQVIATSSRTTDTRVERRTRQALVVCEAGLSVILAASGAFLILSFTHVLSIDKGFDPDEVLTFQLSLEGQYAGERRAQFHTELLEKLGALPGVVSAGLTSRLPLQGETFVSEMRRPGVFSASGHPQANYRYVSPDYFKAAGTPLQIGRSFEDSDRVRDVAILSAGAARKLFGTESAIGKAIEFEDDGGPARIEVIGVVAEVKAAGLEKEAPSVVYLPFWRITLGTASYVVRSSTPASSLIPSVRETTFNVAADIPIFRVREMSEIVDAAASTRRLQAWLAGGFAAVGVLLTCLGLFGVVSYSVSKRINEIGVRLALGATPSTVTRLIVREALKPVLIGLVAGTSVSTVLGRVLSSQLFGVRGDEPAVLGAVAMLVLLASLSAAYLPAFRASRIEPTRALRWD